MTVAPIVVCTKQDTLIDCRPGKPFTRVASGLYVSGNVPVFHQGAQVFSAWGCGTTRGQFIGASTSFPFEIGDQTPQSVGEAIRGGLTLLAWIPDGSIYVLPDPVGNGLVYRHENDIGTFISPDLGTLVTTLDQLGFGLKKSILYPLGYLATPVPGGSGLVDCSYESVDVLPSFSYAHCSSGGAHVETYETLREYWSDDGRTWEDGVQLVKNDIVSNLRSAASHDAQYHISQLTGGLDSRTVFAGLRALSDKTFAYSCNGDINSPDKKTAMGLAATFNVPMTEHTGLNFWRVPETIEQAELWAMMDSFGMLVDNSSMHARRQSALVLSGGCGEFMRTQPLGSDAPTHDARAAAESRWGGLAFSQNLDNRVFTDSAMERLLAPVREAMGLVRENSIDPRYWGEVFYMLHRNRYFVGQISRGWSAYVDRFDPLYSLEALKTVVRQPRDAVSTAAFQADVMNSLSPGISWYPYDKPRFSQEFEEIRGYAPKLDFVSNPPKWNQWRNAVAENMGDLYQPKLSSEAMSLARRLNTSPARALNLGLFQKRVMDLVSSYRSELEPFVNVRRIISIVGHAGQSERTFRLTRGLFAGLSWYADELPSL